MSSKYNKSETTIMSNRWIGKTQMAVGLVVFLVFMTLIRWVGDNWKSNNQVTVHSEFDVTQGLNSYISTFCSASERHLSPNFTTFSPLSKNNKGVVVFDEGERNWIIREAEQYVKHKQDWTVLNDFSTVTSDKYQFSILDLDLSALHGVDTVVLNTLQKEVLPQIAQTFDVPLSLLRIVDVSLLKMTNGVGPGLLLGYLKSGQLAAAIPLRKHKVSIHATTTDESTPHSLEGGVSGQSGDKENKLASNDGVYFAPTVLDHTSHRLFEDTEYLLVVEVSYGYFNSCEIHKTRISRRRAEEEENEE